MGHVSNRILHDARARVAETNILNNTEAGKLKSDIGLVRNGFSREIMMEFDTQCR